MITLFSTCKPFKGVYRNIQHNALRSWARLRPRPYVILFGDDEGTKQAAEMCGFQHVPVVKGRTFTESDMQGPKRKATKPSIPAMFQMAERMAPGDLLVYVNSDMLLTNLTAEMLRVQYHFSQFLFIGQRHNVDVSGVIDFSRNWIEPLRERGELHLPCGIDYIGFTEGLWKMLPDFTVGYIGFDNYLVVRTLEIGVPVVDGTRTTLVFHQNHPLRKRKDDGDQYNIAAWGKNPWEVDGQITHATWLLNEGGVWKK